VLTGDHHEQSNAAGRLIAAVHNPHANKLTVQFLAAVAEHEREMDASAWRGPVTHRWSLKAAAGQFTTNVLPVIREVQAIGVLSHKTIAQALNERGVRRRAAGAAGCCS
jgi:hypothetical protein